MACDVIKVVADVDIPYLKGVLEPFANVVYIKGDQICRADLLDADVLIVRTRTQCRRELLEGTSVQLIATATIGFDHIDTTYCAAQGVEVETAAGCNARGVLQWVAAVLALHSQKEGWLPQQKSIGVVGVGHVGSLVAKYARLWGFNVLCCDPVRARNEGGNDFVQMEEIVAQSDIITFHVPLTLSGDDATYHIANCDLFEKIKYNTLIINSSRGAVVDSVALKQALLEGHCQCAIDTWEGEPQIDPELARLALVATPHIAGYSAQGKATATAMVVAAVARRYAMPLVGWSACGGELQSVPDDISWEQLRQTIGAHFDIASQSRTLVDDVTRFEELRNGYNYRDEYF